MTARRPVPAALPHPLAYAWYGLAGGLCGGSIVGTVEALARLSLIRPTEYEALAYAYVLYGGIGALLGLGGGVLLVPVGRLLGVTPARAWSLGFHGVAAALGVAVVRAASSPLAPVAPVGFGLVALVGVWLGGHLLTKTPLRVLPRARGTAASWGGGLVVVALLSLAPAPGAVETLAPRRPQATDAGGRPDVVLVVVDGLRADALDPVRTPALDAFAADAVVFDQYVAASATTAASVGALFSGRPPSRHRSAGRPGALADEVVTLAEHLRDAGYATGGLPNTPALAATFGFDQGFDWYAFDPAYPLGASASTHTLALYGVVARLYKRLDPTERVSDHFRPAADQLARAQAFLDANRGDRAFAFVHLAEPAGPWFPAPLDGTAYTRADHPTVAGEATADARARYAGAVERVDRALGDWFAQLRAAGRYDDLVVIVTGDHGLEVGEHGGAWDGETLYEELVHVPLIVKLPRNARAGTRVPWQVRQIDVAPTLADLAGLAPDPGWEGTTLFEDAFDDHLARLAPPEARDDDDEADRLARSAFVAPTWAEHPASRDALSELDADGTALRSIRSGGLKLVQVVERGAGARRLPSLACYDLRTDPAESRDLTRDDPTCAARLAERLHAGAASAAPSFAADDGEIPSATGADPLPEADDP